MPRTWPSSASSTWTAPSAADARRQRGAPAVESRGSSRRGCRCSSSTARLPSGKAATSHAPIPPSLAKRRRAPGASVESPAKGEHLASAAHPVIHPSTTPASRAARPWAPGGAIPPDLAHSLGEGARLVAEQDLDLRGVDDPRDHAVAELLVAYELALAKGPRHVVGLEVAHVAAQSGLGPLLFETCRRADPRRARRGGRRGARTS